MRTNKYAIAIIGPNGVGKTAVAFELARRAGGEVINLDKIYLFKHFRITSGLTDTLKEKGVKRHLYELLEPEQEIIPPAEYAEMVRNTAAQILSGGGLPIIEGGSTTYFPALFEANRKKKFCEPIIGLRPPLGFNLREKFTRRVDAALQEGAIEEVKKGLKKYRNTMLMKETHFVVPLVRYLDGDIGLDAAREETVERCLKYADQQMEVFVKYPGIIWLEHESARLPETVEKILTLIGGYGRLR